LKYIIRLITLLARKGLALLVILGLLTTAFISAMNLSQLFILINDGMELRANTILGKNEGENLSKYFDQTFLDGDTLLQHSVNDPYYKIKGSSYSLKIQSLWAWPWQTRVTAVAQERVTLEGELKTDYQTAEQLASPEKFPAPAWENYVYDIILEKRENGSWIIREIRPVEALPASTARPAV
jgi:hypothetical protein